MALNEAECQKCRVKLGKLKAQYEGAGEVPDVAKARLSELEAALGRECNSGSSSSDKDSSDDGAGAAIAVGLGLVAVVGLIAALIGSSRQ